MKRGLAFCYLIVFPLLLVSCQSIKTDSAEIPKIESWKEIIYSEDSNNDKNDRGQIFVKWFQDPRGDGYDGMVLYHTLSINADPTPIIKSWGFRKDGSGGYDWSETRVAMWLEDKGIWFVGDSGERLKTSRQYKDKDGKTISVTYTFNGRNSSISKTIQLEAVR